MFDKFYNEVKSMIPVTESKTEEFRFHFNKKLGDYLKLVKKYKNALGISTEKINKVTETIDKLKNIVRNQYNGLHSTAFTSLNNLLGINSDDDVLSCLIIKKIPAGRSFYRMRKMEDRKNVPFNEMFHIPFNKRGIVSTQRYSFPGYPCLYLGESIYACWEELGRPLMGEAMVSRFECTKELQVVDIRTPLYEDWEKDVERYLTFFPIILACSFKVNSGSDSYKPEYIIPQLIMEIIIKYNRNHRDNCIYGVYYSSVNKNEDFRFGEDKLFNIAVPVIKPLPTKRNGKFCEYLSEVFQLTSPTCSEFENGKFPLVPNPWAHDNNDKLTENERRYRDSMYGLIEQRLNDINYFPLNKIQN